MVYTFLTVFFRWIGMSFLPYARNAAFDLLYDLCDSENEHFETIIFMNVDDLLELIW